MNLVNLTRYHTDMTVATDRDGREHYLVVVKATFIIGDNGDVRPAPRGDQAPLTYADEHHGDPEQTSVRSESDFALVKHEADVLLIGSAHAPGGRPVKELQVELQVGGLSKRLLVVGERRWKKSLGLLFVPDATRPFTERPLRWEDAFGGSDTSAKNPKRHKHETRNLHGRGMEEPVVGAPLPSVFYPRERLDRHGQKVRPAGFGVVQRSWRPRSQRAGTYDDAWKEKRFPLLPKDFDDAYHQCAPDDQRHPLFEGGEPLRLVNLSPDGEIVASVPRVSMPIAFRFQARSETLEPRADTLILEPDRRRLQMVWRASLPVGAKLFELGEILVGEPGPARRKALTTGKRLISRETRGAA